MPQYFMSLIMSGEMENTTDVTNAEDPSDKCILSSSEHGQFVYHRQSYNHFLKFNLIFAYENIEFTSG